MAKEKRDDGMAFLLQTCTHGRGLTEKDFLELLQLEEFAWFLMTDAVMLTINFSNDGFVDWHRWNNSNCSQNYQESLKMKTKIVIKTGVQMKNVNEFKRIGRDDCTDLITNPLIRKCLMKLKYSIACCGNVSFHIFESHFTAQNNSDLRCGFTNGSPQITMENKNTSQIWHQTYQDDEFHFDNDCFCWIFTRTKCTRKYI